MELNLGIDQIIIDKIIKEIKETDQKYIIVEGIKSHVFGVGKYWYRSNLRDKLGYKKSQLASRAELDELMVIRDNARSMELHWKVYGVALSLSGDIVCSDGVFSCFGGDKSKYFYCNAEAKRKPNKYLIKLKPAHGT